MRKDFAKCSAHGQVDGAVGNANSMPNWFKAFQYIAQKTEGNNLLEFNAPEGSSFQSHIKGKGNLGSRPFIRQAEVIV
jgi:hypothetical protein